MTDKIPAPTQLPSDTPSHAVEVQDAQAVADDIRKGVRAGSASCGDVDAAMALLRGLVAAHGADGVRRMLDSLK